MKTLYRVFTTAAAIRENPEDDAAIGRRDSQLLFGEGFIAEKHEKGWVYGRSTIDGYQGWVKEAQLKPESSAPTHFTDIAWTHIYPEPSFKTQPLLGLSMLSRLEIDEKTEKDGFVRVPNLGWIFARHVRPLTEINQVKKNQTAPVETALKFLGKPYLYGGRGAEGIDCSGLIQIALLRAGLPCPRDSDQQEKALGRNVARSDIKRGDIVFFPGHVGIMEDETTMINATARHMQVLREPLATVEKANKRIVAIKRL